MRLTRFLGALVALSVSAVPALAETYPSHPITMMVGFPPGGPTDALARLLADGMKNTLGQPVVVETVSGAAGTIATGRVVHADPDGYTIGIGNWSSHVGSPAIYPLDYDVLKDLQPISLVASSPLLLLGKEAIPPKTSAELVTWLKSKTEPTTFGTVGSGSAAHLCGVSFQQKTGAHLQYVPYRGAGPAIQDLIGGQIDLACLEASAELGGRAGRQDEGLRGDERTALAESAGYADDDRIRHTGAEDLVLARAVDDKGTPQAHRRSPRQSGHDRAGRPGLPARIEASRPGDLPARSAKSRRRSPPITRPSSINGGRSSRRPTSRSISCNKRQRELQRENIKDNTRGGTP